LINFHLKEIRLKNGLDREVELIDYIMSKISSNMLKKFCEKFGFSRIL